MRLGMIGLGRMGGNMAKRLQAGGHEVVGYEIDPRKVARLLTADSFIDDITSQDLRAALDTGRYIAVETMRTVREEWLELRRLELDRQEDNVVEEAEDIAKAKDEQAPTQANDNQEIDIEEIEV